MAQYKIKFKIILEEITMENKGNLQMDGLSSAGGGEFYKILINGKGTVTDDVNADYIEINGMGTLQGNAEALEVKISGTSSIKGNLDSEKIRISGTSRIDGDVESEDVKIEGHANIGGNLKSERVRIDGKVTVGGNVEAETFESQGHIKIGKQLNAESIQIEVMLKCEAEEIVGSDIRVRRGKASLLKVVDNLFPTILMVNTIEGDKLDLDCVNAKHVQGQDIIIGPECEIDMIEYSGTLQVDPKAVVRATSKI